ncbi:hypothetical protein QJQ58_26030 [Paenibacillus dendritiformis]|uniref:hypothetical protein n=1 Tax=Paenibacillus dendritiformis TaxID=130049 RepID=UPI00248B8889|nr:hypothetical protein [Paenibacillus dendritiformis]WGU93926.1 hypothetical protein QJQ58_26030 [Paenibacillus dendritiformis]
MTRLKENTVIEPLQSLEIPEDSKVTMDEWVLVGSTQKRMKHKLRMMAKTLTELNSITKNMMKGVITLFHYLLILNQ